MTENQSEFKATCCRRGTVKQLTWEEALFIAGGGASLGIILPAGLTADIGHEVLLGIIGSKKLRKGNGLYELKTDCGYLIEGDGWRQCSVHEDPDRPKICSKEDNIDRI